MDGVSKEILDMGNVKYDLDLKTTSPVREQCTCGASEEDVVSELTCGFDEALQVDDVKAENICDNALGTNGGRDMKMTKISDKGRPLEHDETPLDVPLAPTVKSLCKCATFPQDHNSTSADSNDKAHSAPSQDNVSYSRSLSLPVPLKLVSAMKGSREKEGLPLRKLSVSWAPDVYDPPPSSVSHLPKKKSNQQYRNNKRHGKGKQKGKNSRNGKKDKKNHRVGGERAQPSLGLEFTSEPVAIPDPKTLSSKCRSDTIPIPGTKIPSSEYRSTMELLDFDNGVDSPDSNCGSSFLRKSRGTLHFPYAEAT